MEHVVFYTAADGSPAYRRTANLDDAVRVVEHLRNAEGREEVHVYSLATVALNFRPYYRVELNTNPAIPAHEEPQPVAHSFTAPVPVQMHAMSAELAAFSVDPVEIVPLTTDEVAVATPLSYEAQMPLGDQSVVVEAESAPMALEQAMAAVVEAAPVEAAPEEAAQVAEPAPQLPPPPPPFVESAPAQVAAPPPPPAAPAPDPMGAFMPVHPGALPMPPAPEPAPAMAAAGPAEAEDAADQNGQGRGRSLGFFTR